MQFSSQIAVYRSGQTDWVAQKLMKISFRGKLALSFFKSQLGGNSMAKKQGPNKSELIRKHMDANPDHKPADIKEALKSHKVSIGLINAVRAKTKAKNSSKKKAGKKPKAAAAHHASNGHSATALLHSALGLGLDKAIALLQKVKAAIK